jgi:excisionase family DNA binding protein
MGQSFSGLAVRAGRRLPFFAFRRIMRPLLTVREVAKMLSVSPARTYELIRHNCLPVVRIRRQIRISPDALDQFIRSGGVDLDGSMIAGRPND